jgi:hypothetical protein
LGAGECRATGTMRARIINLAGWRQIVESGTTRSDGWLHSLAALVVVFGGDRNFHVTTFFEPYVITMFIGECIFNAEIAIPVLRAVNGNLCFFRSARLSGGNDLVNGARHAGTRLFARSCSI